MKWIKYTDQEPPINKKVLVKYDYYVIDGIFSTSLSKDGKPKFYCGTVLDKNNKLLVRHIFYLHTCDHLPETERTEWIEIPEEIPELQSSTGCHCPRCHIELD